MLIGGDDSSRGSAGRLLDTYPLDIILEKKGKAGCTVHTRENSLDVPVYPIDFEVDPTGSGDCFDAAFLCGLMEKRTLSECGRIGAIAGALNAMAFGPMEGKICRQAIEERM